MTTETEKAQQLAIEKLNVDDGLILRKLRALGVVKVVIDYDGMQDSGAIEAASCRDADDCEVEEAQDLMENQIWNILSVFVPVMYSSGLGAFGDVTLDISVGKVILDHHQRVDECVDTKQEWETYLC